MGLKETRAKAIECLKEGRVQAEERPDIQEKNLLKTGKMTAQEVIDLLRMTRGAQYRTELHRNDATVTVHYFEPTFKGANWHIKLYFLEPDCWFISVHKSHVRRNHGNLQRRR